MFLPRSLISRRSLLALTGAAMGCKFLPVFADSKKTESKAVPPSSTLFYRPGRTGDIWDTWIYYHNGKFYLYYNPSPSGREELGGWNCIALATSNDGVHWQEQEIFLTASDEKVVMLGSGAVWTAQERSTGVEKFIMNFSEARQRQDGTYQQTIYFAESQDLVNWKRLSPDAFKADTRWYEPNGRWDNLWPVPRKEGGYYGYWAATPKDKKVGIGFGESPDGIRWRALEPPLLPELPLGPPTFLSPEVGAVHIWGDRYYALIGIDRSVRHAISGAMEATVVADSPFGPFLLAKKNRRLLVGSNSYFTRFVDLHDEVLVNHHSWEVHSNKPYGVDPARVYMAPIKKAHWDDEGTLRLMWWSKNDAAKAEQLSVVPGKSSFGLQPILLDTHFDPNKILILEGIMPLPNAKDEAPTGLYLQGAGDKGTAFLVRENGAVHYGSMRFDGTQFEKEDDVDRELPIKSTACFRLLRKGRLTEFYLNDYLMQCYSPPEVGTGRVGLIGPATGFRELSAWYCR